MFFDRPLGLLDVFGPNRFVYLPVLLQMPGVFRRIGYITDNLVYIEVQQRRYEVLVKTVFGCFGDYYVKFA